MGGTGKARRACPWDSMVEHHYPIYLISEYYGTFPFEPDERPSKNWGGTAWVRVMCQYRMLKES
jgi:hypothetical protein